LSALKLGYHVSILGGIDKAVDRAVGLGCDTFQIFTRNPRSWKARDLDEATVEAFRKKRRDARLDPVFGHMPYILNLASPEEGVYRRSVESLAEGVRRCSVLGIPMLVTHIGSHLGTGGGVPRVVAALRKVLDDGSDVTILLENGSGSKNGVGSRFEELGERHNDMVGKKCANLGEMVQLGLPVPPGFALSIDMYRKFIRETGAEEEMARYIEGLGELKDGGITLFEEISKTIQGFIREKDMPPGVKEAISAHYHELCERVGIPDMSVSVRSAGTESRPGMFETYLNVRGIEDVLEKVKKVWAS